MTAPSLPSGPHEDDKPFGYLKWARHHLKKLELDKAKDSVGGMRELLGFPATKPRDRRELAWVLEGIRICMFIDCEQGNSRAVDRHVAEVENDLLEPGGSEPLPGRLVSVATGWARGWRAEVRGQHAKAYSHRRATCIDDRHLARVAQLTEKEAGGATYRDLRYGNATEAALLVDCYTDWIRTVRREFPPIGTTRFKRQQLAEVLLASPILDLLDHDKIDIWSYRRACTRLGFEAADRTHKKTSHFLGRAEAALKSTKPALEETELARLERPLISMELTLAEHGRKHDPDEIERHRREANELLTGHLFRRRLEYLNSRWDFFIKTHSDHCGGL